MANESRLFVGNLSYQTLEKDLQDHFSQAGVVTNTNIMLDKFTGKSRGFAFIEYSTPEEALQRAVELFHNKEFQGRPLTVNIARPREERPQGGGGGGGGYRGGGGGGGGGYRGDRGGYDRGDRDRRSE